MNKKKLSFMSLYFISIYIINAASISHSFAALTRERYFQHSKIKFVSPRGYVIFSIYSASKATLSSLSCHATDKKHCLAMYFALDAILYQSIPRAPMPPPTPGQTPAFDIYTYPHSQAFDKKANPARSGI